MQNLFVAITRTAKSWTGSWWNCRDKSDVPIAAWQVQTATLEDKTLWPCAWLAPLTRDTLTLNGDANEHRHIHFTLRSHCHQLQGPDTFSSLPGSLRTPNLLTHLLEGMFWICSVRYNARKLHLCTAVAKLNKKLAKSAVKCQVRVISAVVVGR